VRPGLTAAQLPTVVMDPRTAYDFLTSACLECGELEDLLAEDRAWLETSRTAIVAELGPATEESISNCTGFVAELGRMLVSRPEIQSARDLVAATETMTDRELVETMVGELLEDADFGALTRRALDGDDEAYRDLRAKLDSVKGHNVMTQTMAEMAATARAVIKFWLPLYEPFEARIGRMLQRDVAARAGDNMTRDPIGFVERTTNGIRLIPEPRIRRIVMAPSYFGRPYNSLTKVGDIQLIAYPIADSALGEVDRLDPPASAVRLYRALGDDTRLRILRLLAERDRYLTELANELGLSKPTVSHHMAQLRSAGLVTVSEQANLTYYTLRRDRADEAGPELSAYLAH
jgi:DNA-binding transcriptional ArsR family regulator